jgi:hypothetical protein
VAVNSVWVVPLNEMLLGWVGALTSVVTDEEEEEVAPVVFTAVTTSAYAVSAVKPENVAYLEATPLSASGVVATPFRV